MDMKAKVFGQKIQDKEYHDREAAYLVKKANSKIAKEIHDSRIPKGS